MSQQLLQALAPGEDGQPCGVLLDQVSRWELVENEMMKVGSLAHQQVKWQLVSQCCLELLGESKDLRLVSWLAQVLQNSRTLAGFSDSILLLSEFIDRYWLECFPLPGIKGKNIRKKLLRQIAQRTTQASELLKTTGCSTTELNNLSDKVLKLQQVIQKHPQSDEFSDDSIDHLIVAMQAQVTALRNKAKSVKKNTDNSVEAAPSPGIAATPEEQKQVSTQSLELNTSDQRSIKQSLLNIAHWYFESARDELKNNHRKETANVAAENKNLAWLELALMTRRQAIWFSIDQLPQTDAAGQSQLMPVSDDRIQHYTEQLDHADFSLWQQVEQSLTVAPFWLDGHELSAQIASKLGFAEQAEVIRRQCQKFIERLPQIKKIQFKGGQPFVTAKTEKWLQQKHASVEENNWQAMLESALQEAKQGGLDSALQSLNQMLEKITDNQPREQFYGRLLIADFLQQQGLNTLAAPYLNDLLQQAEHLQLELWEPALVLQLQRLMSNKK